MSTGMYVLIEEAAASIRHRIGPMPPTAIVLGSGLGEFADAIEDARAISYDDIPHFPEPTVSGHRGRLVVGKTEGTPVAVLQGRFHHYEGHDLELVTFPIRVLRALGVSRLILTAATGAIRPDLAPGSIVAIEDHLNLLGENPLRGANDSRLGPRFPDLSTVYPAHLRAMVAEEAAALGIDLRSGVYACMPGPSYETPAEVRMVRILGGDVVGMSTVPEAIVATHGGMGVIGLAIVSNWAAGIATTPISHDEVIDAGRAVAPRLSALLGRVVRRLATDAG